MFLFTYAFKKPLPGYLNNVLKRLDLYFLSIFLNKNPYIWFSIIILQKHSENHAFMCFINFAWCKSWGLGVFKPF